ncbi:MAG: hypothetical protein M1820_000941 [Bogoriella megaspora]|nr:MAG: hypothetical protein M1820_000941 [Bogoriella megaspora]
MSWPTAPTPKTVLGYHRILSPSAAVRVSPLCLGAMNFGDAWKQMMGECDKETSFKIMDKFYDAGGNFIDTANNYQNEESEEWVGEWMKSRGVRDEIVLATKYTTDLKMGKGGMKSNYTGNHAKSLHISVEASLKKLQTDYIDILYVHWWDHTTSVPEVMRSLNQLVLSGKVLYLGISDTPAWIVSKANEYARAHGMAPFVVYQGLWSASVRDFEREILPMCEAEQMGIAPWGALGRGNYKTEAQREATKGEGRNMGGPSETDLKVSKALEPIANRKKSTIISVALAYIMHKYPYCYPIVGGRKVEHLEGNIEALSLELSEDDIKEIESAYPFEPGFPHGFLFRGVPWSSNLTGKDVFLTKVAAHIDTVSKVAPIKPRQQ